jgi:hypothetical protein
MWRTLTLVTCGAFVILSLTFPITGQQQTAVKEVTFTKDIAPILFNNCVYCHRPGEIGPFSLISYRETRPWSKSF